MPTYGGGLSRFDIRSRLFTNHKSDPSNPNGLSDNYLFDATPDRSGMVWVGTELFGLDRFNPASVGFVHYRSDPFDPSSLPGTNVWDIEQMRDGSLWIATAGNDGDAITHMQREPRVAKHYRHDPNDPRSIDVGGYLVLHEDKAGTLWIGTSVGLDWFDSNTETFYHYQGGTDDPTSLATKGGVWALNEDHAGNLWIGGMNSIARLGPDRNGKFQNYPIVIPGAAEGARTAVLDIEEDPAGFLWLGLRGGLVRLDPSTGAMTFYTHDPDDPESLSHPWVQSAVVRDREPGIVWAASSAF